MQFTRLSLYLSISACVLAIISFFRPHNCTREVEIEKAYEKNITDLITNKPHIIFDALNAGIVNKRDSIIQEVTTEVNKRQEEVIKSALKVGSGKTSIICVFDPSDTDLQKHILNNLKSISFYLMPIDLTNHQLAKLYYAIYLCDKTKLTVFIENFIKSGNIEKALRITNIKKEQLKKVNNTAIQNLHNNTELSKELKIPSIPTLLISKNQKKFNMILTAIEDHDF